MSKKKKKKCKDDFIRETPEQRQWVLRRDNYECQFVNIVDGQQCKSKERLEVHHIVPVVWAYVNLKWTPEQVNAPENLITLCSEHHQKFIHPDFGVIARVQYKYNTKTYELAFSRHIALARKGVIYWQPWWDNIFKMIARVKTFEYKLKHPNDPYPLLE